MPQPASAVEPKANAIRGLFCSRSLPREWRMHPMTEMHGEGWVSGPPRPLKKLLAPRVFKPRDSSPNSR
jgi:hypothetical protein